MKQLLHKKSDFSENNYLLFSFHLYPTIRLKPQLHIRMYYYRLCFIMKLLLLNIKFVLLPLRYIELNMK